MPYIIIIFTVLSWTLSRVFDRSDLFFLHIVNEELCLSYREKVIIIRFHSRDTYPLLIFGGDLKCVTSAALRTWVRCRREFPAQILSSASPDPLQAPCKCVITIIIITVTDSCPYFKETLKYIKFGHVGEMNLSTNITNRYIFLRKQQILAHKAIFKVNTVLLKTGTIRLLVVLNSVN